MSNPGGSRRNGAMKIRLTSKHYEFTRETEFSVTFQMSEKTSVCYAQARFNMATDIEP
jgi:hypothetical protein